MEKKSRREFIKTTGTVLLATTGITVFGVFTGSATPNSSDNEKDGGFYDDGYYGDGYYGDGYATAIFEPADKKMQLLVLPNPSNGKFSLKLSAEKAVYADIYITDLSAKTWAVKSNYIEQGVNDIAFDLHNLPVGLYTLSVVTATTTDNIQFIITR
jgi:hypothetical protein